MDDLARAGYGYELRGVRGWAGSANLEDSLKVYDAAAELRRAYRRGSITRANAGVPDARRPLWIYRIADAGARRLATLREQAYVPVAPPSLGGEPRALMPPTVVAAMDALRYAAEHPGDQERVQGEPEWRTSLELTRWLYAEAEHTGVNRVFMPGDLERLVTNGLAQSRRVPPLLPDGKRPVLLYRISITGAALRTLVWHGADDHDAGAS
ncbi:hypothetical protein [Longimicrobium terrae]|uniref:Uncharacterized protein n=1 Tax=Longimicrobium terrae TaxID=1639882 RepID=A0A841GRQ3_9BACT|nr:hypothetical protein [Longimicrobium terrae]MBB4635916.1 hypothetical protein [Longimicrobium terrae]MBB6070312.1 hypothetical protein [Longimicrobium terrae]NNC30814.1 hypothetical protein [Longimicrobium terrae]